MKHVKYLRRVWSDAISFYKDHPHLAMSLETGFLMGTGDIIAQKLLSFQTDHEFQARRFCTFTGIGLFVVGPCVGRWYYFLDRTVKGFQIESRWKTALAKMALDQFVFAPTFMVIVMVLAGFLIGKTWEEIKETLRKNYFSLLLANYEVWPLFQFINFSLIPLRYQLIAGQTFAIMWNTYFSWKLFPKEDMDRLRQK